MAIELRGTVYHLRKRVPRRYSSIEPREYVSMSLGKGSEAEAREREPAVWQAAIDAWEIKLRGGSGDTEEAYEAAKALAEKRGFRFLPADKVARLPIDELMERLEIVMAASLPGRPDMIEAAALLGFVHEPQITLSRALDLFWSIAEKNKTRGKSAEQIRRWRYPRQKAFENLISVIKDKPVREIDADDMLDFRQWWEDRIEIEGLTPSSANKDLSNIRDTLKTVNLAKRLGLNIPLSGLNFSNGRKVTRPPFSKEWIRDKLLAPGALDGLNLQARCLMLGMVNTGYRPSEGTGLRPQHIRLDTDIPHISIEPFERTLKSQSSHRIIPLTGVSLEAFKACPGGFPEWRDNPTLSATVNGYLRQHGLQETPRHTLYCLRHSFEDRMLAAEIDERIRRDLFGHSLNRERYGKGASLDHLLRVVESVAI